MVEATALQLLPPPSWNASLRPPCKEANLVYGRGEATWGEARHHSPHLTSTAKYTTEALLDPQPNGPSSMLSLGKTSRGATLPTYRSMKKESLLQMNLSMKQKQTHRHREQICGCQRGGGWRRDGLGVWD